MKIKVSDLIVKFFISKGINHVFGYPGGMITHLMDSLSKNKSEINAHICYHEQGAAFAACGYAQTSGKPGVVYATSGPGVTNLLTGIANAYYDSIPLIAIVGQVNTYEQKCNLKVRQKGFQEMEVCEIVKPITKYTRMIDNAEDIISELQRAYMISLDGRMGPVVLDIPMNIQRAEIDVDYAVLTNVIATESIKLNDRDYEIIKKELMSSKKPVIIAGNGINAAGIVSEFREMVRKLDIPVVTSMIGISCIESGNPNNYGFIGAYGHRTANFIIEKADLVISMGSRLDCRQTGNDKSLFATNAKIIRIDIDEDELTNKIKDDEVQVICDVSDLIRKLIKDDRFADRYKISYDWKSECNYIRDKMYGYDNEIGNNIVMEISKYIPDNLTITTDVGQNQVWISQSFKIKDNQKLLFSGGHGAMGYSLPAAIGAFYASESKVISFNGDGGIQMNIQELQTISENKLPVKIIILNNNSLGMIRHFQEMYFDSNYEQTKKSTGYGHPDFIKVGLAYGIESLEINDVSELFQISKIIENDGPSIILVNLPDDTYVYPKLAMGRPIYDQEPLMDRDLLNDLLSKESVDE